MPVVHVPTPCAVYIRENPARQTEYVFSHCCDLTVSKVFPSSLRVADLRAHDARQNWGALHKACFILLVTGDVAQCVSVSNAGDKNRTKFLYHGSSYARRSPQKASFPSELHENYVSMHFHATMAVFDTRQHALRAVIPLECGVCLLPKRLRETDLPRFAKWIESCMQRSVQSSVWVAEHGDSYNESSRLCSPHQKPGE